LKILSTNVMDNLSIWEIYGINKKYYKESNYDGFYIMAYII